MKHIQQGDVCLEKSLLPKNANKLKSDKRGFVLAEGEHTGHFHAIVAEPGVELYEHEGTLFLTTNHEVELTHQEHNTITIPPGQYEVGRISEYDHFADASRIVAD